MAVIDDDFGRANGSLGTATVGGVSQGWSWSVTSGGWGILSNAAANTSGAGHCNARADSDLATADHYAQANVTLGASSDGGVFVRFAAAADTGYILLNDATNDVIYKNVAGSYTSLASAAQGSPAGALMRLEVSGSSLTGKRSGTTTVSTTDSSITGNLRGGIRAFGGGVDTVDNFQAGDLSSGTSISGTVGTSTWAGQGATVRTDTSMSASVGTSTWSGQAASVATSTDLQASVGISTWSGLTATVVISSGATAINATVGISTWVGAAATIVAPGATTSPYRVYRYGRARRIRG